MYLVYNLSGPIGGKDSKYKRFTHLGIVGTTVIALPGLRQALLSSTSILNIYTLNVYLTL